MLTAISPTANNLQSLTQEKPQLSKDSIDKEKYFKSVRRPSGLKQDIGDRVIPFNASMLSPRDD